MFNALVGGLHETHVFAKRISHRRLGWLDPLRPLRLRGGARNIFGPGWRHHPGAQVRRQSHPHFHGRSRFVPLQSGREEAPAGLQKGQAYFHHPRRWFADRSAGDRHAGVAKVKVVGRVGRTTRFLQPETSTEDEMKSMSAEHTEASKDAAKLAQQGISAVTQRMGKVALGAAIVLWIAWFFLPGVKLDLGFM